MCAFLKCSHGYSWGEVGRCELQDFLWEQWCLGADFKAFVIAKSNASQTDLACDTLCRCSAQNLKVSFHDVTFWFSVQKQLYKQWVRAGRRAFPNAQKLLIATVHPTTGLLLFLTGLDHGFAARRSDDVSSFSIEERVVFFYQALLVKGLQPINIISKSKY